MSCGLRMLIQWLMPSSQGVFAGSHTVLPYTCPVSIFPWIASRVASLSLGCLARPTVCHESLPLPQKKQHCRIEGIDWHDWVVHLSISNRPTA